MGQIFSSAALSPFLMRFTIHRREQIAAQSQCRGQHKHRNCVEVYMQSVFDTCKKAMANTGWSYCAKIGNIDDHQAVDSRYAPSIIYDQAFNDCLLKAESVIKNARHVRDSGISWFYLWGVDVLTNGLHKSHHLSNINDTDVNNFSAIYWLLLRLHRVWLIFRAGAYHLISIMPCANTGLHSPISFILTIY